MYQKNRFYLYIFLFLNRDVCMNLKCLEFLHKEVHCLVDKLPYTTIFFCIHIYAYSFRQPRLNLDTKYTYLKILK